ncbi:MAG: sugar transferase [Ruminococcus sp.]|nr:sugar transferase [Ruminococcus sp.]
MIKSELTKAMRWELADHLAQTRLDEINKMVEEVKPASNVYSQYIKRLLDIILSALILLITFPLNLVIFIITACTLGRPIFFKQERIGKDGKPFMIVKFRNMTNETDENGDLLPPAKRVTKCGKFLRKTSLDELLNFWSILKGDMSLIGPRPLVPEYTHRYNKRHKQRLVVRPGLECPPRELTDHVWTWQEQFENDVWYVEHVSFLTDCKMVINLVRFALDRKSANARAGAKRGTFFGYDQEGNAINLDEVPQYIVDELFDHVLIENK